MSENAVGTQEDKSPINLQEHSSFDKETERYLEEQAAKEKLAEQRQNRLQEGLAAVQAELGSGQDIAVKSINYGERVYRPDGSFTHHENGVGNEGSLEDTSFNPVLSKGHQVYKEYLSGACIVSDVTNERGERVVSYALLQFEKVSVEFNYDTNTDLAFASESIDYAEEKIHILAEKPLTLWEILKKEFSEKQVGEEANTEGNKQKENHFKQESFFSPIETYANANNQLENEKNNFLNFELIPIENKEPINITSYETKEIASLVTEGIRENTIQERENQQNMSVESPTEQPTIRQENKKDVRAAENINLATEKAERSVKIQIEKQPDYAAQVEEQTSIVKNTEKQVSRSEISQPIETVNHSETAITISFSESLEYQEKNLVVEHTQEDFSHSETKTSPKELVKLTMRPIAETKITISPTMPLERIQWGQQFIADVLSAPIAEPFQREIQELTQRPVGTEMVITNAESVTADTAFIFRVEEPGSVTVELYKTPITEVIESFEPIVEHAQHVAETKEIITESAKVIELKEVIADQVMDKNEPIANSEVLITERTTTENESKNSRAETSPERSVMRDELIGVQRLETLPSERKERLAAAQSEISQEQAPEIGTNQSAANNSERRRLTINSLFADVDEETLSLPTSRQQPRTTRARELVA